MSSDDKVNMMEKIDPYKMQERYEKWKLKMLDEKGNIKGQIKGISKRSSDLIVQYVSDMEQGINVSVTKGNRSYTRLVTLKDRMRKLTSLLKDHYGVEDVDTVKAEELHDLFTAMKTGKILTARKKTFKATADYIKIFKAFWHWWMKINKKKGKLIHDVTEDLDTSRDKPKWVYLSEKQFKRLCDEANYRYRVLMTFLYDSGIRSPSELINVRMSDLEEIPGDKYQLTIRDEVSKTFGRSIKLMFSSRIIKEYIQKEGLKGHDQLFPICHRVVNQYLSRLGKKVLGDGLSKAGEKYSRLTMYDFRHNSCCYWVVRYKNESALKYRFGWKESDKIHYYSEFLGMKDTITEQDLLVDVTASEIERMLEKERQERELLEERFEAMAKNVMKMLKMMDSLRKEANLISRET